MRTISLIALTATLTTAATATDPIVSRFTDDLEGWTAGPGSTAVHETTGGNPLGRLVIYDAGVPDMAAVAPAAFLGDLTAFDGGTFSFDTIAVPVDQQGSGCLNTFGAVTITSPAGIAGAFVAEECPAFDCWKRFDVPFDAASWGVTQEAWSAILADVTSISIRVEAQLHDEATGLDNIALLPPGVANVDLSGDGVVGVEDVLILLGGWGPCGECCPADLDGDGIVGVSDVLSLLGGWG